MNPLEKGPFKAIVNLIEKRVYTTTVPQKYYDPILTSHSLKVTSYAERVICWRKLYTAWKFQVFIFLSVLGENILN